MGKQSIGVAKAASQTAGSGGRNHNTVFIVLFQLDFQLYLAIAIVNAFYRYD